MKSLLAVFALLALLTFTAAPALAHTGCTPGFWKNNTTDAVWGPTGYHTTDTLGSVFSGVTDASWAKYGINKNDSLLTALSYQGGSGLNGAAQILLRTAVAALLNAAHFVGGFTGQGTQFVIDTITNNLNVTWCFAGPGLCGTDDALRASLVALASLWDSLNNENPCPIDAFGRLIG